MITGFEKYTHELTEYELTLLPMIIPRLKTKLGKEKAVTNSHICKVFKEHGHKLDPPRFRKIVQYIRVMGLIPCLISTSKGYYVATSKEEIRKYIESFDQRINSMTISRDAMEYQMKQKFK